MDSLRSSCVSLDLIDKNVKMEQQKIANQNNNFDSSVDTQVPGSYPSKQLTILTVFISISFCVLVMQLNMTGPTLLYMGHLLQTEIKVMSLIFTFEWCGYLVGCILCGFVYETFNEELQFAVSTMLVGIATILSPWLPTAIGFFAVKTIQFIGLGYLDILGNTKMLNIWEGHNRKNVVFALFQTMGPIGALIGPMIISFFVVDIPQDMDNCNTQSPIHIDNVSLIQNVTGDAPCILDENADLVSNKPLNSSSETQNESDDVAYIRYSYVIIGCFSLLLSIVFGFAFLLTSSRYKTHRNRASNKRVESKTKSWDKLVIAFLSMASFSMSCLVIRSWITPFVLNFLDWNAKDGQYMAATFGSGMVAGRVIGILLLVWISPGILLFFHILSTLMSVVLTYLAVMLYPDLLWICVPLIGFSFSSSNALLILWISGHMIVTSSVISTLLGFYSLGYMFTGFVTGYLFETHSPLWVLHLSLIACSAQLIFFVASLVTVKISKRRGNVTLTKYVDDEQEEVTRSLRT